MKKVRSNFRKMLATLATLATTSSRPPLFLILLLFTTQITAQTQKPNVLFIAIDDMNDWTGFLDGHPQAITPNMDKLAEQGMNFTNAHCVSPACGPSRNALLFGIEPYRSGLYPFYDQMKMDQALLDQYVSLPQLFKESGYHTYGSGKIHHGRDWTFKKNGGQREWTENNQLALEALPDLVYDYEAGFGKGRKMAFCPTKSPLDHHPDYVTAMFGVDVLEREHDQPFFLALGFVKPHLPFVCPKEYFDLYEDRINPPAIRVNDLVDVPWAGRSNAKINDDFNYRQDDKWQKVHRAYLACNSWTDANVGRVIEALESSPYKDNTIIVLWSDHGYHQGEKRSFRKFSLWEESTKVPFIIIDPRNNYQGSCEEAVSLQDIFPTLTEMAGLEKPDYVGGVNLLPWLQEPSKAKEQAAITTWGRGNYTIRTKDWRYVRYFDGSEELYHHPSDPQEWFNLAQNPGYRLFKNKLATWLPDEEAPLVKVGKALHNVVDADQPSFERTKENWARINAKIDPPLEQRPNIIWLMAEDISNDLACYGMKGVQTPNLDRLANLGNRYNNCFSTNPICSPNRSAMMVGVHQNRINAQHHRSNRNVPLAEPYKPITYWLREAGYTCILGNEKVFDKGRKTDCNFKTTALGPYDGKTQFGLFDKFDTFNEEDQPFFAQIQLKVTHRGDWWEEISRQSADPVDPEEVELPPFMADDPIIRQDWARYLDQIEYMDAEVGMLVQELEEKGMANNTVIIFIGDNGRCNIRGKGYLHDPGLRVPLIVHWPGKLREGQVKDDIISVTDISASILQIAGAEMPDYMTGIPFIGTDSKREVVYSARDLWDEVVEKSRSITTQQYKYIRNDMPWVPFDAHQGYLEFYRPAVHVMRKMEVKGELTPSQSFFFGAQKPNEELYDLINDPYELNNLANDPGYIATLKKLRKKLVAWEQELPNLPMNDFDLVVPAAVKVLDWVRYEKPELYLDMLNGKEIGFQRLSKEYRNRKK